MLVALFHPKPVAKGKGCTERHCVPSSDSPRRRQEKEVYGEKKRREKVEGEIGDERELGELGDDETLVNLPKETISHDCMQNVPHSPI